MLRLASGSGDESYLVKSGEAAEGVTPRCPRRFFKNAGLLPEMVRQPGVTQREKY